MGTVIHFKPELKNWMVHNLNRGASSIDLVRAMTGQGFEWGVANALVQAVASAWTSGQPIPDGTIEFEALLQTPYQYEAPRLSGGNRIVTADRVVDVVLRAASPVLAVLDHVLSAEECDQLIALATPRLNPSTIVDPASGKDVMTRDRSSEGMFFRLQENALVSRIDQRVSRLMNLPVENGEGLQVLHYGSGAKSTPHFDYLSPTNEANRASITRSGQRVSTIVIYLNAVEEGGETYFPEAGVAVTPKKGRALYFEYCNSLGQLDERSLHAALPVIQGEKWVVTKWMRQRRFISAGNERT